MCTALALKRYVDYYFLIPCLLCAYWSMMSDLTSRSISAKHLFLKEKMERAMRAHILNSNKLFLLRFYLATVLSCITLL